MAGVTVDDAVDQAWTRLTSDDSPISWIACGYPEKNLSSLVLKSEGTGGMPEFIAQLPEDDVVWGAFKVMGVDDRGTTVSRRPKFIFVKYMPAGAPSMKKARTGGHKGSIKMVLNTAIDVELESKGDLTEDIVVAKLRAAGGAHQPTRYEFSNYSV